MKRWLSKLIAAYVYHTPPHPGRGILARLAYWLNPGDFIAEIAPNIKIKVRLNDPTTLSYWTHQHEQHGETEVSCSYLKERMIVFDVGAHYGVYALFFAQKVGPTGKVYAFEPVPENFVCLKEHIALNNVTNIISVPLALSDRKGVTKISVARGLSSQFCFLAKQFVEVPMTTLDAFIAEQGIKQVDTLKLDVEGAELYVIRGAHETIQQHKPIMMVEINFTTLKAANTSPDELFNTIVSYGYDAFVIRNGKDISVSKVLRKTGYQGWDWILGIKPHKIVLDNYLFLPKE